ncbi:MAG: macro domain-containing protein [Puniceicoccales bacterium]|jgi:O-acetyl-ADP-ribose deacetylase (regulator of RNase III)|nr:macro domain-containing protein [Puniceicoccales bacterium]
MGAVAPSDDAPQPGPGKQVAASPVRTFFCKTASATLVVLSPALLVAALVFFLLGGFLITSYWREIFTLPQWLWAGALRDDDGNRVMPTGSGAARPNAQAVPAATAKQLELPGDIEPTGDAVDVSEAARNEAAVSMKAKFDGLPAGQKHTMRVSCSNGSVQEINLFFSLHGNPVDEPTEVLVNAANEHMIGGGGICGAIYGKFKSAGYDNSWRSLPGFPLGKKLSPGEVFFHCGPAVRKTFDGKTATINYPRFVVQACGPDSKIGQGVGSLAGCYKDIARGMVGRGASTVTHNCISTNIYQHDPAACAKIAVGTTVKTLTEECAKLSTAMKPMFIWFSIYQIANAHRPRSFDCYANEFAKLRKGS